MPQFPYSNGRSGCRQEMTCSVHERSSSGGRQSRSATLRSSLATSYFVPCHSQGHNRTADLYGLSINASGMEIHAPSKPPSLLQEGCPHRGSHSVHPPRRFLDRDFRKHRRPIRLRSTRLWNFSLPFWNFSPTYRSSLAPRHSSFA